MVRFAAHCLPAMMICFSLGDIWPPSDIQTEKHFKHSHWQLCYDLKKACTRSTYLPVPSHYVPEKCIEKSCWDYAFLAILNHIVFRSLATSLGQTCGAATLLKTFNSLSAFDRRGEGRLRQGLSLNQFWIIYLLQQKINQMAAKVEKATKPNWPCSRTPQ